MIDKPTTIGKQKNYLILFTLFIILFTACQNEYMDIPDTGRKIVINGLITTDTLLNVNITKSTYISEVSGTASLSRYDIDSAEVYFYQNNILIDSLHHDHYDSHEIFNVFYYGNYWSRSLYPLPGKEYKVVVKKPSLPDASAITTIPEQVRIERVDTSWVILSPGEYYVSDVGLKLKIEFSDPVYRTNYYLFR